jgi:hypothetical protein
MLPIFLIVDLRVLYLTSRRTEVVFEREYAFSRLARYTGTLPQVIELPARELDDRNRFAVIEWVRSPGPITY